MTRKIFLDGNPEDRPSLTFTLFLCLIPLSTFFYMKRRQRNRYNRVPVQSTNTADPAPRQSSRPREEGGDIEALKKGQVEWEKEKKKLVDEAKAGKTMGDEEIAKRLKTESDLNSNRNKLYAAEQTIIQLRKDLDAARNPNDPFLHNYTPLEAYDNYKPREVKAIQPGKSVLRPTTAYGENTGKNMGVKKKLGFDDTHGPEKHAISETATYLMPDDDGPGPYGIVRHGGSGFVERTKREDPWQKANEKKNYKGRDLHNDQHRGPDHLRNKTAELKKLMPEEIFAIFDKATQIASAQKGSAEYEGAMEEQRDDDFGVFPSFADAPMTAIIGLLHIDDSKVIWRGMKTMSEVPKRSGGPKDPDVWAKRYCMTAMPDNARMIRAWYLDSFRLVSSAIRMNIIRGKPLNLQESLGVKFVLLEWLEIFGVRCAHQRLLSPRGFDIAGLCIRINCMPDRTSTSEWADPLRLTVTIFLPGGADKVDEKNKKLESWGARMTLAVRSWSDVWAAVSNEAAAAGIPNWSHGAFQYRELVFCPGFTFEGIKQTGGFPSEASNVVLNNRYEPVLNAFTPPHWPWPGDHAMQSWGKKIVASFRPTAIIFRRRRQFTWATPSLSEKSHDLPEGMVALCLVMCDPLHWTSNTASLYPEDLPDESLAVRLDHDDVTSITFGSTIPMTMDTKKKPIGFPDVSIHPKLNEIVLAYVPLTRHTDGTPAAEAPMPATATLALSESLGLKKLLQDRGKIPGKTKMVNLVVDIRSGDVQKLADELLEMLVGLGKKRNGAEWTGDADAIDNGAKEDKDLLKQIYYILEDDVTGLPIAPKIANLKWSEAEMVELKKDLDRKQ